MSLIERTWTYGCPTERGTRLVVVLVDVGAAEAEEVAEPTVAAADVGATEDDDGGGGLGAPSEAKICVKKIRKEKVKVMSNMLMTFFINLFGEKMDFMYSCF